MSNQILFQNKFGQFREHILPHVFLVMAKHCAYTIVSKVAKSMGVVHETFAREQEHQYVKSNDIGRSSTFIHNHNYLMETITFKVHSISLTSPRNMLAIIFKIILILFSFHVLCIYFSFKHIMHEHIRERKEIPNLCKPNILFSLCKCYTLPHDFYELHTNVL